MLLKLLSLPVSVPVAGFRFCISQLVEMAEQEMLDDGPVREDLLLLTLQFEEGEIDEGEYARREAELMRRLREIRAYKEQHARAQAGLEPDDAPSGPVVVRVSPGSDFVVEFNDLGETTTEQATGRPDFRQG
jgi:hypothetical protein